VLLKDTLKFLCWLSSRPSPHVPSGCTVVGELFYYVYYVKLQSIFVHSCVYRVTSFTVFMIFVKSLKVSVVAVDCCQVTALLVFLARNERGQMTSEQDGCRELNGNVARAVKKASYVTYPVDFVSYSSQGKSVTCM